ncbi:MAG: hypothetical protein ACNA7Q_08380, partial [Rhodobacterales bacterium]
MRFDARSSPSARAQHRAGKLGEVYGQHLSWSRVTVSQSHSCIIAERMVVSRKWWKFSGGVLRAG